MGGTMLALLAGLGDMLWSPQTRRTRKAELRRTGLLLTDARSSTLRLSISARSCAW